MSAEAFWDGYATKYAAKPFADPDAYEAKLELVKRYLKRTDRVLEFGCGTGSTALNLAPFCDNIVATDFAQGMISIANNKKANSCTPNVVFKKADATDHLEDEAFDVVMAFSLLHLTADVPAVLSAVRKQLKPDGLFLSKTVCLDERGFLLRQAIKCVSKLPIGPSLTFLTQRNLSQYLDEADFAIERLVFLGEQNFDPFIIARRRG